MKRFYQYFLIYANNYVIHYTYCGKHLLPGRKCEPSRKLFLLGRGPNIFFELSICVWVFFCFLCFFALREQCCRRFWARARVWYFVDCYRPARPFATSSCRPQQNTETLLYQATSAITVTIQGDPSFTLHPSVLRLCLHLKMSLSWWNAQLSLHLSSLSSLFAALQCCSWSSSSGGHEKNWWAKGSCRVSTTLSAFDWVAFRTKLCVPSTPRKASNRMQGHQVSSFTLLAFVFPSSGTLSH